MPARPPTLAESTTPCWSLVVTEGVRLTRNDAGSRIGCIVARFQPTLALIVPSTATRSEPSPSSASGYDFPPLERSSASRENSFAADGSVNVRSKTKALVAPIV